MTANQRLFVYAAQNKTFRRLTPRQERRINKKQNAEWKRWERDALEKLAAAIPAQ